MRNRDRTRCEIMIDYSANWRSITVRICKKPHAGPMRAEKSMTSIVYITTQTATAEETLKRIGELYAIEKEICGLTTVERLAARQSRSKPLLVSLHEWLVEKSTTLSKKSRLGEAFAYALNQWDALCHYCDDGLTEPDNNAAERALRAVCLGKKIRHRSWWRAWSPAIRSDRNVQTEWYRSGSLPQIYPEHTAGVAFQ